MFLYLDIGNSRIKWAITDTYQSNITNSTELFLAKPLIHGAHYYKERNLLPVEILENYKITTIWYANVAGIKVANQLKHEVASNYVNNKVNFRCATTPITHKKLKNSYLCPQQLGIDRWLAALAAIYKYPNHQGLLVIDAGTATSIDLIGLINNCKNLNNESNLNNFSHEFLGGWIIPGLSAMYDYLHKTTAQLPSMSAMTEKIFSNYENKIFAKDTNSGIRAGCMAAQIGAIKHAWLTSQKYPGGKPICLLTGGASNLIYDKLDFPVLLVPELVLLGLKIYSLEEVCK